MKSWSEKKVKYGCCKWLVLVQILYKKYNGKFPNTYIANSEKLYLSTTDHLYTSDKKGKVSQLSGSGSLFQHSPL